ncbi:MAG: hydrogenase maturation protease [Tannerellaceae bacterium]
MSILILGIGNLLLCDESIGIRVATELENDPALDGIDVLDGGTGGFHLMGTLQEYDDVVLIDATLDSMPPGTIRVLKPKYSTDYPSLMSAHEIGLKTMIDAMILNGKIPRMHLVIISVKKVDDFGMELTPEVEAVIPEVKEVVRKIVKQIKQGETVIV